MKIADFYVQIGASLTEFSRELKKVGKGFEDLGREFKKIGTELTLALTVPIVGLGVAALAASEKATAAFKNFKDETTTSLGDLGTEIFRALNIQGLLDAISESLRSIVDWFSSLSSGVKIAVVAFSSFLAVVGLAIFLLGQLTLAIKAVSASVATLQAVITAHPLIALATAVAAIVVALGIFSIVTRTSTSDQRNFGTAVEQATLALKESEDALSANNVRKRTLIRTIDQEEAELKKLKKSLDDGLFSFLVLESVVKSTERSLKAHRDELAALEGKQLDEAVVVSKVKLAYEEYQAAVDLAAKEEKIFGDREATLNTQLSLILDLKKKLLPILRESSGEWKFLTDTIKLTEARLKALNDKSLEEGNKRFADSMLDIKVAQELAIPGFNSINAELQARIQHYRDLVASHRASNEELTGEREKIEALQGPAAQLLGHIQENAITAASLIKGLFDQVSQGIGNAIAQIIVYGGKAGEVFKQLGKTIASSLISTIIQGLIQIAVRALLTAIGAGTAYAAQAISGLTTFAALTYAGAFAATAAIPIVGPALAAGVATAAVAAMLSGAATSATTGAAVGAGIGAGSLVGGLVGAAAQGGIFTRPAYIRLAERHVGPEVVLNNENLKKYLPAWPGGRGRGGRSGRIEVPINIDGREAARGILPGIWEELDQHGAGL